MGKFLLQAATLLLLINASNTTLEKNRLTTCNTKKPDSNNIYKEFKGTWCYEHGDVRLEVIIMAVKTTPVLAEDEILFNERLEGSYILMNNGQAVVNTSGQVYKPAYPYIIGRFEEG